MRLDPIAQSVCIDDFETAKAQAEANEKEKKTA